MKTKKTMKHRNTFLRVDLADELGCSPASLYRKLRIMGVAVGRDGGIDRQAALEMLANSVNGHGGGWGGVAGQRGKSLQERAAELLKAGESNLPQTVANSERDRVAYAHTAGQAYLAEALRADSRVEPLYDTLVADMGVEPALALRIVRLFAVSVSLWVKDRIEEHMGKKALREFDGDLARWIRSWKETEEAQQ